MFPLLNLWHKKKECENIKWKKKNLKLRCTTISWYKKIKVEVSPRIASSSSCCCSYATEPVGWNVAKKKKNLLRVSVIFLCRLKTHHTRGTKKRRGGGHSLPTWPVCSVSSLLIRYIRKNLRVEGGHKGAMRKSSLLNVGHVLDFAAAPTGSSPSCALVRCGFQTREVSGRSSRSRCRRWSI